MPLGKISLLFRPKVKGTEENACRALSRVKSKKSSCADIF